MWLYSRAGDAPRRRPHDRVSDAIDAGAEVATHAAVREAFERVGGDRTGSRGGSSSVVEDLATSSMAGQFDSVIGIHGFDVFVDAVKAVLDSRERAGAAEHPIGVLVQPLIEPAFGGVMFGVDPVTGRTDRRVVSAVLGGPEPLVSGEVNGSRYVLDASSAKVVEFSADDGPSLATADLRRLVDLSATVASVFGGPQDVEWAIATDKQLWLLSRARSPPRSAGSAGPTTARARLPKRSRHPLTELERDLWVPPLCDAVSEAVVLAGSATEAQVDASDVVVCVDGHVAIDLRLAGEIRPKSGMLQKAQPDPRSSPAAGCLDGGAAAFGAAPSGRASPHRTDADL